MRRLVLVIGLMVAGCSTDAGVEPPPPVAAPTTPIGRAPLPTHDTCGAAEYQGLIGRPRSEIPVPVRPQLQRVACTTCPVTMDFNPNRLNFLFDAATGLIREVKCG